MLPLSVMSVVALAQETSNPAILHVESSKPGLVISGILARGTAVSSTGATARAVFVQDLCTAPCSLEGNPGFAELYAKGGGHLATPYRFELKPGENRLLVEPASSALFNTGKVATYLGLIGAAALGTFAYLEMSQDKPAGLYIGGAAGSAALAAGGIALQLTHRGSWTLSSP